MPRRATALAAALSMALVPFASADVAATKPVPVAKKAPDPARLYERVVKKVANMVDSDRAYTLASAFKLQILNVLWEDTGRWEGSSVGPNISDVTIEVEGYRKGKAHRSYLMRSECAGTATRFLTNPGLHCHPPTTQAVELRIDDVVVELGP